jgi:hypothetical protein
VVFLARFGHYDASHGLRPTTATGLLGKYSYLGRTGRSSGSGDGRIARLQSVSGNAENVRRDRTYQVRYTGASVGCMMADFDLTAFTNSVHAAYEEKVGRLLPMVKLGYIPDPDESLPALGSKFSRPVAFEDSEITMEWTPGLPEPEAFADALADGLARTVERGTIAAKEFEQAPQVFVFHRALPTNALPGQALQHLAKSDKTCLLGQLWFEQEDRTQRLQFRTRRAVCQVRPPETEQLAL